MSDEQNKAIVRSFLETGWKRRDLVGLDKYAAANHVNHGPFTDQTPTGIEGDRAFIQSFLAAFPDVQYTIDGQETEGDLVKTWITYRGTMTGPLMNMPATGKRATVQVFNTDRIANGKIVESWAEWDVQDFMRQLGLADAQR